MSLFNNLLRHALHKVLIQILVTKETEETYLNVNHKRYKERKKANVSEVDELPVAQHCRN